MQNGGFHSITKIVYTCRNKTLNPDPVSMVNDLDNCDLDSLKMTNTHILSYSQSMTFSSYQLKMGHWSTERLVLGPWSLAAGVPCDQLTSWAGAVTITLLTCTIRSY